MKHSLLVLAILIIALVSCKTYDTTLSFYDVRKPIMLGNFETDTPVDSLREISGFLEIEVEEDTYSENENASITMIGGEYIISNLDSTILNQLQAKPSHFIANSTLQLEIRHGMKVGAVLFGTIAASITGEDSDIGTFTTKKFTQKGVLFDSIINRSENE